MTATRAPLRTRLGAAFSPRRNLRHLWSPNAGHLRAIDGLRALSILWVVLFHAGWYSYLNVPKRTYFELLRSRWMLPVWRGDFGVDMFFVLSGFLIAGLLLDERAHNGRVRVRLFYLRRLMRLWPALAVAVVIDLVLFHDRPEMAWPNLLYVSNFVPLAHTVMPWTWSLAIEEQFYLLAPWLVLALAVRRARAQLAVVATAAAALCCVAAAVVVRGGFHADAAEIVITRSLAQWVPAFEHLYIKPWMRAGPLLAGVGAAFVYRTPGALAAIARARWASAIGFALAVALAVACTHWPLVAGAPRAVEVAYVASFRTLFGAAVAAVALLSLSGHPIGRVLGRVLSVPALAPFAQLAYSAYLLNPIVATMTHRLLVPYIKRVVSPMVLYVACDVPLTFAAALALYLFVERPLMELRPRVPREAGVGSGGWGEERRAFGDQ